jgi:hypothetical protein
MTTPFQAIEDEYFRGFGTNRRHDTHKSRPDLFPPRALALAGEVLAFGESKHPDEKWKSMSSAEHLAAAMRHYLKHQAGNTQDAESNKPHLAHALVRLAMALERHLEGE